MQLLTKFLILTLLFIVPSLQLLNAFLAVAITMEHAMIQKTVLDSTVTVSKASMAQSATTPLILV